MANPRVNDQATKILHTNKDLELDSESSFTAAGTNTLSGATTISGAVTQTADLTASGTEVRAYKKTATAKTASYTVTVAETGNIFTNRGDTDGITFTLPAVTNTGAHFWFYCVEDFAFAVAAPAADTLVTFNCNAATSVKLDTVSERIGGGFYVVSDGTKWLCFPLAEETQTVTVA